MAPINFESVASYLWMYLAVFNVLTVLIEEIAKYCLAHSLWIPNIQKLWIYVGFIDKDTDKQFLEKCMPQQIDIFEIIYYRGSEVFLISSRW